MMIFYRTQFQGLNERWPSVNRNLTAITRKGNGFPNESIVRKIDV